MDYATEFSFWRENMFREVMGRLGKLLLEFLKELSQGGEFLVQSIDNEVRWLQIHLEFFELKEYNEDMFIDARKIGYHASQLLDMFLESTCSTHQKKCDVVKYMLRSYCRIAADFYRRYKSRYWIFDKIFVRARGFATPVDNYWYDRGWALREYMSEWVIHQGDEGSSSSASGGQVVVDVDEDEDFVGLKEQVDLLVDHLVNEGGGSSTSTGAGYYNVVSVCGMGGLGKTTIAKAIYNHPVVREHFHRFIWASMSSNEGREGDILYGILSDLLPGDMFRSILARDKVGELERLVRDQLQLKKCLIVLDGICTPTILSILRKTISMNMNSRIVVTSRNSKLLCDLIPECLIYVPRFLNEDESWELLLRKAFKNRGKYTWKDMNRHLNKEIWKELVIRCGGLPLAIVELGELMSLMKLEELRKEEEQCPREVPLVPAKFKSFPMQGRVLEVLSTSYNELPHELRSCFRYLRNIEADSEMGVNKLCQLWIAESLIPEYTCDVPTTMGIARYCLEVLASRSMVQLQIDESTGLLNSCRLHTLLRHICFSKGNEEDLHVMNLRSGRVERKVTMSSPSSISKINKLVVHLGDLNDIDKYVPPKREIACKLHSLLFFLERYSVKSKISRLVESRLSDFKDVRVLDLGGLIFSKLHKSIGKLTHLKYLGLRYAVFHELPSTIASMKDLQTLDLWDDGTQYAFTSIPNVLWKLSELRHLYLRSLRAQHGLKMQLDRLSNLETLENFEPRVFNVKDLDCLRNLRKLGAKVCNKSDLEMIIKYLVDRAPKFLLYVAISIKYCDLYSEEGQSLLEKLLCCRVLRELSIDGRTGKLPGYNHNFSECLSTVTLESCVLINDPMKTLEKLPNLRSLFLKWNAYVGVKMACSTTGFPQLRVLQIHRIWKVNEWTVDKGGMPNLSSLEISSCPNLKTIPHGLQFITTLQKLEMIRMPKEFCSRLQWEDNKRGEDFYKVRHVSSIKIIDFDGTEKVYQKSDAATQLGVFIRGGTLGPSGVNTRPDKGKGKTTESTTDEDEYVSHDMMAWADKGKGKTTESNTDEDEYVPDDEMDYFKYF